MTTHYHDGHRCETPGCAKPRDLCGFSDKDRGPCTLNAGHERDRYGDPNGHLLYGEPVVSQPDRSDRREAENIAAGRLSTDDGDMIDLGDVLRMGSTMPALLDGAESPLEAAEHASEAGGYPEVPAGPVRPPTARTERFPAPSGEQLKAAGEHFTAAMRRIGEQLRESSTATASTRALVAALIDRAKTDTPPTVWPDSASTVVDDVCEALRGTGLLGPADLTVIRSVIVHLMRGKR